MSRFVGEFKNVLQNYTEVFDIYYTDDQKKASQIFYTKEFPEIFPYVVIIDPKKRKGLKSAQSLVQSSGESGENGQQGIKNNSNSYVHKYREIVYFNKIEKDLNGLIEKFLDGELHHFYQSEKVEQATNVKKICAANFEKEVIKNPKVGETGCVIEIFKHDCPSCQFNVKVFNAFSRKLEKHGF